MKDDTLPTFCRNCGMPGDVIDISGCTRDTETAHDFVLVGSRPYRDWDSEAIVRRLNRAVQKATSASITADHFVRCPAGGADSFAYRLYAQKAHKRMTLAGALLDELDIRMLRERDPELPTGSE